jgi:hypothetical protein
MTDPRKSMIPIVAERQSREDNVYFQELVSSSFTCTSPDISELMKGNKLSLMVRTACHHFPGLLTESQLKEKKLSVSGKMICAQMRMKEFL